MGKGKCEDEDPDPAAGVVGICCCICFIGPFILGMCLVCINLERAEIDRDAQSNWVHGDCRIDSRTVKKYVNGKHEKGDDRRLLRATAAAEEAYQVVVGVERLNIHGLE